MPLLIPILRLRHACLASLVASSLLCACGGGGADNTASDPDTGSARSPAAAGTPNNTNTASANTAAPAVAAPEPAVKPAPAPVDLSGTWAGAVSGAGGSGPVQMRLNQQGRVLAGSYQICGSKSCSNGSISGSLDAALERYNANLSGGGSRCTTALSFIARIENGAMTGTTQGLNNCAGGNNASLVLHQQ